MSTEESSSMAVHDPAPPELVNLLQALHIDHTSCSYPLPAGLDTSFTLMDLMTMQPELNPTHLVNNKFSTVKQLRSVSKEMGITAMQAVTSCEVHVGKGNSSPNPQQLAKLLAGAKLQHLTVVVTVSSGPTALSIEQQLVDCNRQMGYLTSKLGQAINSVTKLTLKVIHALHREDFSGFFHQQYLACVEEIRHQEQAVCLTVVTKSVFTMLAKAVPNLRTLELCGDCWDAALKEFGSFCPQLANLCVHALVVPAEALSNFGRLLPSLLMVTFWNDNVLEEHSAEWTLAAYMDIALLKTGKCSQLIALHLDFQPVIVLRSEPDCWDKLPASLLYLRCPCFLTSSQQLLDLVDRVPRLCLRDPFGNE